MFKSSFLVMTSPHNNIVTGTRCSSCHLDALRVYYGYQRDARRNHEMMSSEFGYTPEEYKDAHRRQRECRVDSFNLCICADCFTGFRVYVPSFWTEIAELFPFAILHKNHSRDAFIFGYLNMPN